MSFYYDLHGRGDESYEIDVVKLKPKGQKLRDLISGLLDDEAREIEFGPKQYRAIRALNEVALDIATECINGSYGRA